MAKRATTNTLGLSHSANSDTLEVYLNDELLGTYTYDEHGSDGVTAIESLIMKMADRLGLAIVELEPSIEEEEEALYEDDD